MWRSHDDVTWPARAHRSWSVPSASTDSWRERWKPPSNGTPSSELDGLQMAQRSQRKVSLAFAPSSPKEPAFVPWAALGPGFRREVRAPSITAAMLEACLAPRFTTVACFARAMLDRWPDGRCGAEPSSSKTVATTTSAPRCTTDSFSSKASWASAWATPCAEA